MNRLLLTSLLTTLIAAAAFAGDEDTKKKDTKNDDAKRWEKSTTLENLQEAYNGESNANAKYLEYAKKAEEEGYMPVASLFRAAAKAEKIHAENHAQVIKALGAEPKKEIKLPEIKTTKENLEAAISGEKYERDKMYPAFLQTARKDRNRDAMRTLNFARTAEGEHAKLYQHAVDNLEKLKSSEKTTYMVCATCGYTVDKKDFTFEKCPSCFDPKEKYEAVS